MPRDWKEDALHHKYDPLPEEPMHRKKARNCATSRESCPAHGAGRSFDGRGLPVRDVRQRRVVRRMGGAVLLHALHVDARG